MPTRPTQLVANGNIAFTERRQIRGGRRWSDHEPVVAQFMRLGSGLLDRARVTGQRIQEQVHQVLIKWGQDSASVEDRPPPSRGLRQA